MMTNLLSGIKGAGVCVCMLAASSVSAAETDVVNIGELQNGVPTEYPGGFAKVAATFIVPEDGPMRVTCTGTELNGYADAEHTEALDNEFSYVNAKPMRVYQCKKGQTVYFYSDFSMTGGTITVTSGDMELKCIETYPSANPDSKNYYGGSYSISNEYRVQFAFNLPVVIEGARMTVNGTPVVLSPNTALTTVEVTVSPSLMTMYKNGTLKKGDVMHVELYGVHEKGNEDNKVNGDGVVSADFVMDGQPIELVSTTNTPTDSNPYMLSYYMPDDPGALVKLTFSGPVQGGDKLPVATLSYGDLDNIDAGMYYENPPVSVDGNTVIVDFSGKRRRSVDMLPLLTDELEYISLGVRSVIGEDGQRAYTGEVSNPTAYFYSFKLKTLQYNVVGDFTPAESKGIEEGKEMEIFVMDGKEVSFDGVKFAYTAAGEPAEVVVAKDDIDISTEGETDIVILLDVPALPGIDADSQVTVTLANMLCTDGLDHTDNVKAVYGGYTSGIEDIAGETEGADVYNTQGVLVLKGAKASDIRRLPAGIYVSGGRKIAVR